jgi:anti-sigma-K factor RskA
MLQMSELMTYFISAILVGALLYYVHGRTSASSPPKASRRFQNAEMVRVLLSLEERALDELFKLYKEEFGQSAARYARQTYHKWQAGAVRPNRQTFNRFFVYLPGVMSFDLKCEVLRKLREEYCAQDSYQLTVYTDEWKERLTPLVTGILEKARRAELPPAIEARLRWLSADEMQVARALLTESQAQESRTALSMLEQEISNIEQLLARAKGSKVIHKLKLPCGIITLKIKRRARDG